MRRILLLVLVLTLAGCTVGGDKPLPEPVFTEEPRESQGESPRAFVFESGVLEFGDFDSHTIGDELFNPCTEITDVEYIEAGFHGKGKLLESPISRLTACGFEEKDGNDDFVSAFSNADLNRAMNSEAGLILSEYKSEIVPEIYVVKGQMSAACYAQIDTVRGGIGTNVGGTENVTTMDQICQRAIEMLEDLFTAHGTDSQ